MSSKEKPMANYNWVDYIILAIFLFSMLSGFIHGFISKIISLATLIAAFIISITFASPLANAFLSYPSVQNMLASVSSSVGVNATQPVSYLAIGISFGLLFAATVMVGSILSFLIGSAFKRGILGIGNRFLGAIFGLVQGFMLNLLLIFLVQLTPLSSETWWQHSALVGAFQPAVQWLGNLVSPVLSNLKAQFGQTLQDVNSSIQNISGGQGL